MCLASSFTASALIASLALGLTACSSDEAAGSGSATFVTYGEEFIEDRIPADEFADGWSVKFSRFLINLGQVELEDTAGGGGTGKQTMGDLLLLDMTKGGRKPVHDFANIDAKPYDRVSFKIVPVDFTLTKLGNATDADKTLMGTGGYSVYVEGTATKESQTKTFKWGFTTATLYDHCEGDLNGKETQGVVVTNGGTDTVEITIHGDHFFYDDLQSPDAKPRFNDLAKADANNDGEITLTELSARRLAADPKLEGTFGTGSEDVNDLGAFVAALSRTLGHFRGEGECKAAAIK